MTDRFKYLIIYNHYKNMIVSGKIKNGSKLLSIRKCSEVFSVSRTTVQTAYDCLLADGYIYAKQQSGYYVAGNIVTKKPAVTNASITHEHIEYDLASERADSDSFDFKLWQRYIKSALRQESRLLTYGEPQGEYELRCAVCEYLCKTRGAVCSPESIVIGAGFQSLLQLLFPLIASKKNVCFLNNGFLQGQTVFTDNGFCKSGFNNAEICYITPSRLKYKGDVMKPAQRFELAKSVGDRNMLIIEDDYGSEFSGIGRPTPCIQGICKGENVVYISTFSKLLVPSIRISYMVLPPYILKAYLPRKNLYNQTASKIEQLALCKFIQDGNLNSQIRKVRRVYVDKCTAVKQIIADVFGKSATAFEEDSGRYLRLVINTKLSAAEIAKAAKAESVLITPIETDENAQKTASFMLSFYGVKNEDVQKAMHILYDITKNKT